MLCVAGTYLSPGIIWGPKIPDYCWSKGCTATLMERESIEGLAATPSNGFPGSSRNSQYGPLATLFMIPSMRRNF